MVDQSVIPRLVGGHEVIALGVALDLVGRLARVPRVDVVDRVPRLQNLARVYRNVSNGSGVELLLPRNSPLFGFSPNRLGFQWLNVPTSRQY